MPRLSHFLAAALLALPGAQGNRLVQDVSWMNYASVTKPQRDQQRYLAGDLDLAAGEAADFSEMGQFGGGPAAARSLRANVLQFQNMRANSVAAAHVHVDRFLDRASAASATVPRLLNRLDVRSRVVLLCWALLQRTLGPIGGAARVGLSAATIAAVGVQQVMPDIQAYASPEHVATIAGAEVQALEVAYDTMEGARVTPGVGRAELEALRNRVAEQLRRDLEARADAVADLALDFDSHTIQALESTLAKPLALRIADTEVACSDVGCAPIGDYVDLYGRELVEAADLDVTADFVEKPSVAGPRLRLLGLVAAVSHRRVFAAVMAKLRATAISYSYSASLTLEEFVATQNVTSVVALVRKYMRRQANPRSVLDTYYLGYTLTTLPSDPIVFQVAWGLGLAARAVMKSTGSARAAFSARSFVRSVDAAEAAVRSGELLVLCRQALVRSGLSPLERLDAVNTFLTVALIVHEHGDWAVERVKRAVEKALHNIDNPALQVMEVACQ